MRTKFLQGKTDGILYSRESHEKNQKVPQELDLTKPRLAFFKQKWKRHQDTVYWVDVQLAQRKRWKFFQTRCNAIIFYDTLPAYCISKVFVESGEIIYEKACVSLRPPLTTSFKDNWMKEMDSEVAGSRKDTQRIQPKPNYQVRRDPCVDNSPKRDSRNVPSLITILLVQRNMMKSQTQQVLGDPYVAKN